MTYAKKVKIASCRVTVPFIHCTNTYKIFLSVFKGTLFIFNIQIAHENIGLGGFRSWSLSFTLSSPLRGQ